MKKSSRAESTNALLELIMFSEREVRTTETRIGLGGFGPIKEKTRADRTMLDEFETPQCSRNTLAKKYEKS